MADIRMADIREGRRPLSCPGHQPPAMKLAMMEPSACLPPRTKILAPNATSDTRVPKNTRTFVLAVVCTVVVAPRMPSIFSVLPSFAVTLPMVVIPCTTAGAGGAVLAGLAGRLVDAETVDSFMYRRVPANTRRISATLIPTSMPIRGWVVGAGGLGISISGVFGRGALLPKLDGDFSAAVSEGAGSRVCRASRNCSLDRPSDGFVHGVPCSPTE